jgi:hypothetical protein
VLKGGVVVTMALGNVASTNCEVASSLVCCPHVAGSCPVPRCGLKCSQRTNKVGVGAFFLPLAKPLHHGTSHVIHTAIRSSGTETGKDKDPEKLRDADADADADVDAADGATSCCQSCIDFNFLALTLERSNARLRPRQESIRRTTCQKEGWCSVVIGLHRKLA